MDRHKEARRASVSTPNGLSRRRQRNITTVDDLPIDVQESARLRDRVRVKKDRNRERERSNQIKRRRGDRLIHGEESTGDSLNEAEEDDEHDIGGSIRMLPPNTVSFTSGPNHISFKKRFPHSKGYTAQSSLKAADEMIGVSVPRKARSASAKRTHECRTFDENLGGEQAQASPSNSNISVRKKMKDGCPKQCPPKSSSNQDEIEFEIAEVLYGLRQNQGPSMHESAGNEPSNFDSRDASKSIVSSPISNSLSVQPQNSAPRLTVAPKRKKPRPVRADEENPQLFTIRSSPISSTSKAEMDEVMRCELSSQNLDKDSIPMSKNDIVCSSEASMKKEAAIFTDSNEAVESRDGVLVEEKQSFVEKEETLCPPSNNNFEQTNKITSGIGIQRRIQIDLMATPPATSRASSEKDLVSLSDVKNETKMLSELESNEGRLKMMSDFDSEKHDKDYSPDNIHDQKNHHLQHADTHKTAQSNSTTALPINGWPGGISPLGYMRPLQGVLSMEPSNPLFTQPRPKRCATHCYLARNIGYHQQYARMSPFWPLGPATPPVFVSKSTSPRSMASTQVHGNDPNRNSSSEQDHLLVSNAADSAHRKQEALHPPTLSLGAPTNLLHGPAFIFPMNQLLSSAAPVAATVSVRSGPGKPDSVTKNSVSSSAQNLTSGSSAPAPASAAKALSFGYPNMTPNDTQYLAILHNNGYHTFSVPAQVGSLPYREIHPQAMPFFYPSQMLHPAKMQQLQQNMPHSQTQQALQGTCISTGSSNSQKNLQNQSQNQRYVATSHANGISIGNGNSQSFPALANWPLHPTQQPHQHFMSPLQQARQVDTDIGGEDSPSTAESQVSRANITLSQNYVIPSISLMAPSDKRQPQHGLKNSVEVPSQAFAMSFASVGGGGSAPAGLDLSLMAQNRAILKSLPEHARHIMGSAAIAQASQPKSYRSSEEGKAGASGDSSNAEEERKSVITKSPLSIGQPIAFSRLDLIDQSSVPPRVSDSNSQQRTNPQFQQFQFQKQQQSYSAASAARSKNTLSANGSDHHVSSGTSKFSTGLSGFPQNLGQSSNGVLNQSTQWKHTMRTGCTSLPSSAPSLKNVSVMQQQMRPHQTHTQISFGANSTKSPALPQSSNHQSTSSPVLLGSPATSLSKSMSASTTSKPMQASNLSSQQAKNAPPVSASRKSHHMAPCTSSLGTKSPLQQAQLFFSNPYAEGSHATNPAIMVSSTNTGGYYIHRGRQEPQQGSSGTSDPTKAAQFGSGNVHVGMGGYPYVQPVVQAVQMKPTEQKQPAGE